MSIISGLLQQKQSNKIGWMMDAQLSLAPPSPLSSPSSPSLASLYLKKRRGGSGDPVFKDSEEDSNCKRRKMGSEWERQMQKFNCVNSSIGVELQMKSPLPLEWEQCLDLQSGRIYYVNRSTQLKTCKDPRVSGHGSVNQLSKDLRLDLELNLPFKTQENEGKSFERPHSDSHKNSAYLEEENNIEMVATVCAQCHMFIMFSKVSRQCPNCKYVHPSVQHEDMDDNTRATPTKQTLSLIDCGLDSKIKTREDDDDE